jgi:hypothetical protein
MPIFNAAANLSFAKDTLFSPSTESTVAAPEYAFFFDHPTNFNQSFSFDDGVQFNFASYAVVCQGFQFDLNEHNLHYRRLFKLRHLRKTDPRYYLIPWLGVPFKQQLVSPFKYTPVIPSFPLRVTVESIYENRIARRVRKRIEDANSVAHRTLTLVPSSDRITAVWNKSGTTNIDEIDCLQPQGITITISDCDSDKKYKYQEYINLQDNSGATAELGKTFGTLRLLFLERIEHKVVFMSSAMTTNTELRISMLATTSTPPHDYITDLNGLYRKTGVEHIWVDDALTIQDGASSTTFDPSTPADLVADPGVDFSKTLDREEKIVGLIHDKLVKQIAGAENYVFVCFADWAFVGGKIQILGISSMKGRTSCVFKYSKATLCHEAGHALGLPHYFFENSKGVPPDGKFGEEESVKTLASGAKPILEGLSLTTQKKLEELHDAMNAGNACDALESVLKAISGKPSEVNNVNRLFHQLDVDRFVAYNTSNLMDYFLLAGLTGVIPLYLKEKMVKHQIEFLRFFVTNRLFS